MKRRRLSVIASWVLTGLLILIASAWVAVACQAYGPRERPTPTAVWPSATAPAATPTATTTATSPPVTRTAPPMTATWSPTPAATRSPAAESQTRTPVPGLPGGGAGGCVAGCPAP